MIYLFEDRQAVDLEPLTLTRGSFELRCGAFTHLERLCRIVTNQPVTLIVRPELSAVVQERYPDLAVNPERIETGLWLNGAALWDETSLNTLQTESSRMVRDNRLVGASFNADDGKEFRRYLLGNKAMSFDQTSLMGPKLLYYLWDHFLANPGQTTADFNNYFLNKATANVADGVHVVGESGIYLGKDVTLDPSVVLDARQGPIIIEHDNTIGSHSVIKGPCYIGPECRVWPFTLLEEVSLGPMCRIMGQLTNVISQGYSNKQHHGFIGHSYLGSWINLGAGTSNSNLKINYSGVKVNVNGRIVNTGQLFIGCFIGDHAKTAIGTLLLTGSQIGVAASIFDNLSPPKVVPSFSWGGTDGKLCELAKCLDTMAIAKSRRNQELTEAERNLFSQLYHKSELSL